MRGRIVGMVGAEKRHLAGLETLITVEVFGDPPSAVQWPNAACGVSRVSRYFFEALPGRLIFLGKHVMS